MKRIYEQIPLQSVLYKIRMDTHIQVWDTPNPQWYMQADSYEGAELVYDGKYIDWGGYRTRALMGAVHEIDVEVDRDGKPYLKFLLCTKREKY